MSPKNAIGQLDVIQLSSSMSACKEALRSAKSGRLGSNVHIESIRMSNSKLIDPDVI